jgi:hypothetical protein
MNYHLRITEERPMPPADADFAFTIDFKKGTGNPRRVFDAASALIDAFEVLDKALVVSVDSEISPLLILEDVEAGSVKVWLKNVLKRTDDDALKTMDWKPLVGRYLVKAKYIALEFLDDDGTGRRPSLAHLKEVLRKLAEETDVRRIPAYAPIHEGRLLTALDRVQDAKRELDRDDRLTIESEGRTYEVNLASTWEPTESIAPTDTQESKSSGELILTIRKPDFIRDTMWQFSHGKNTISAPIHDADWLSKFHARQIPLWPGDALRCAVIFTYTYDEKGALIDQRVDIERVLEVIKGAGSQASFI